MGSLSHKGTAPLSHFLVSFLQQQLPRKSPMCSSLLALSVGFRGTLATLTFLGTVPPRVGCHFSSTIKYFREVSCSLNKHWHHPGRSTWTNHTGSVPDRRLWSDIQQWYRPFKTKLPITISSAMQIKQDKGNLYFTKSYVNVYNIATQHTAP